MKKISSRLVARLRNACLGVALGICAATVADVRPASAAEDLVFTYGALGRSISIEELATFAETGEASRSLQWYLDFAEMEPEIFQAILTKELSISLKFLDDTLNSLPGEFALFELGQLIQSGSGVINIAALRAALVLSASDNNKISLLEFLQNYPLQQLTVDGVELAKLARDLGDVVDEVERRLEALVPVVQELLGGIICECATTAEPTSAEPTDAASL